LVQRLRKAWTHTKIVFLADSGFFRERILAYCDYHDIKYIIGAARNFRLIEHAADLMQQAREGFEQSGQKQRLFDDFFDRAKSWGWWRWVVCKAEHTDKGANPRFIVTKAKRWGHNSILNKSSSNFFFSLPSERCNLPTYWLTLAGFPIFRRSARQALLTEVFRFNARASKTFSGAGFWGVDFPG